MGTLLIGFALLSGSRGAPGQVFDATNLRQPTEFAGGWLVHAGDDPDYARPGFDDSRWLRFNAGTDDLHNLFPRQAPEVVWYRLRIEVAPDQKGLALLEQNISQAFEIYVNGAKVIQAGRIRPFLAYETDARLLVPIPEDQMRTGLVTLALRVHLDAGEWSFPYPGYTRSNLILGTDRTLREHAWFEIIRGQALVWLDYLLNIGLLLGGVVLYSTQRNRTEYLWLSLWALAWLSLAPLSLYSLFHTFPLIWHTLDGAILCFLGLLAVTGMYCAFVGHRVGWRLRAFVLWVATCSYLSNIVSILGLSVNVQLWASLPLAVFFFAVIPFLVLRGANRGGAAERLLLLPVFLIGICFFIRDSAEMLIQFSPLGGRALGLLILASGTHAGPFYLDYNFLSDLLAKLSLALIILMRSNRMSRQQALLESEMASAREVQQVILPEALQDIPGFRIESVYEPAREVGGDFFQILPAPNGGLLVVIGDVAGKGLPAAMLVSLLVGSIRTAAEVSREPDTLLARMNERLVGRTRGGFSTALVALMAADGSVAIANAGHIPPYLDGRELEIPGTLPLGISSQTRYGIQVIHLDLMSRLAFYTDGVVEAQDKAGQLFGFDRAREISTQPARAIVEAAKAFGQQDDITVITVERVPVGEKAKVEPNRALAPA